MRFSAPFLLAPLFIAACEGKEIPSLSEAARSEFGKVLVVASEYHRPFRTVKIERFAPGMAGGGTESTITPAATSFPELLIVEALRLVVSSSTTAWTSSLVKESPPLKVEAHIATPITTAYPLEALKFRIASLAQMATGKEVVVRAEPSGTSAVMPATRDLAAAGFDTILYVDVLAWGLAGKDEEDPSLLFFTQTHATIVSTSTGEEIYNKAFNHFGHTHQIRQWIANHENLLRTDVEASVQEIAEKIVEEVFLLWRPE